LDTGGTGGWFTTVQQAVTPALAMVTLRGLSGVVARNRRGGEAAEEGDVLVASITFNSKASLETHGDVTFVEGDGICRRCGRGLLVG
jgi:hypothetical protein